MKTKQNKQSLHLGLLFALALMLSALFSISAMASDPITGLRQTDSSTSSATFTWNPILGQNIHYSIEMSTNATTGYRVVDTTDSTEYRASQLTSGGAYYVRVRAYTAPYRWSDESERTYLDYSQPFQVVVRPDFASGAKITQTNATTSTVTISWPSAYGATSYEIYLGTIYIGSSRTTSAIIKGLNNKYAFNQNISVYPVKTSASGFKAMEEISSYGWGPIYLSRYDVVLQPAKITGVAINDYWTNLHEVNLAWTSSPYASGYQIEVYKHNGKKYKKTTTYTSTSAYKYLENITQTAFYRVRIRAYTTLGTARKYGAWSSYKYFAFHPDGQVKQVGHSKKMKLSYKKVKGAKNYTIYMSTSEKGGYKKIATTSKTSYTINKFKKKNLTYNKTYYVKIIANHYSGKRKIATSQVGITNLTLYR